MPNGPRLPDADARRPAPAEIAEFQDVGEHAERARRAIPVVAIERHPLDVLHHDEGDAFVLFDGVDGDAVRVVKRGRGACFVQQPPPRVGVPSGRQDLQRDGAVENGIARTVDRPHPALAKARANGVMEKGQPNHVLSAHCRIRSATAPSRR